MADPMSADVESAEEFAGRIERECVNVPRRHDCFFYADKCAELLETRDAAIRAQARAEALREAIEKLDSARIDCRSHDRATGFYIGIRSAQRQIAELAAERTRPDGDE